MTSWCDTHGFSTPTGRSSEETSISKQLREWGAEDSPTRDDTRYDFLALSGDGQTVVIEIKRSEHPATLEDLQQLERYVNKLGQARPDVRGVFITGKHYAMTSTTLETWETANRHRTPHLGRCPRSYGEALREPPGHPQG